MRLKLSRAITLTLATLVVIALSLAACIPPYSATPASGIANLTSHKILHGGHPLHYVEAGTPGEPLVIFIHGTPGSWQAFSMFLQNAELAANTHMLALDRPGFGESAASGPQPDFQVQSQALAQLLAQNRSGQPSIVVGHSLGGSIAFRAAVDYPTQIGGVLSISSSISPALGKPRWFNRVASLPVVRWLVPGDLGIANIEVMALHNQLVAMETAVQQLTIPITLVQGETDGLVSPANVDYVASQFQSPELRVVAVPDAGHFLIWEQPERIVGEIMALTRRAAAEQEVQSQP